MIINRQIFCVVLFALIGAKSEPSRASDSYLNEVTPVALQQPLAQLDAQQRDLFTQGRSLFQQIWVASPSLDTDIDGLGPTFNQSACSACHARNGRAAPPRAEHERMRGMILRLSIPGQSAMGGPLPHPVYGDQLQDAAISGVPAEGRGSVLWEEHTEYFSDGEVLTLRRPALTLRAMAFGDLDSDVRLSARIAPSLIGMGLLDAVTDEDIVALAKTPRADGISGRVNTVWHAEKDTPAVGRFGWKANMPSLREQSAAALNADMGLSSPVFTEENCPAVQLACVHAASQELDITEQQLSALVFYQSVLAVPARRDAQTATRQQGQALFTRAGCQHCHIPELRTGTAVLPALSNKVFAPYTDLLLHDMGDGLADGRPDYVATGREWRTAPLWGLGLTPTVNEHNTLLHDGRARGVLEAIMWHGGEAEVARERVRAMTKPERQVLVEFIESL